MNLSVSRIVSLIVVAVAFITAWPIRGGFWVVTLVCGPLLLLIWFPQEIDDFTFGSWSRGSQINTHTPGVLVAAMGWIFLVLVAAMLVLARLRGY